MYSEKNPLRKVVADVEAAISHLPECSKHSVRTITATMLNQSEIKQHENINQLKKDTTRVLMKADKRYCYIEMARTSDSEKQE